MFNFSLININMFLPWWAVILIPAIPFILAGIVIGAIALMDRFF